LRFRPGEPASAAPSEALGSSTEANGFPGTVLYTETPRREKRPGGTGIGTIVDVKLEHGVAPIV
jgi:hypothetical protein